MNENSGKLIDMFISSLSETVSIMSGISLINTPLMEESDYKGDIVGAMVLPGRKNALLVISTSRTSAEILVAYMTGIDISDQKDYELYDGMAEIVNMVAGMTKAKFENTENSFSLSSPFTIIGENIKLVTKNSIEKYENFLESNDVQLKLGIYYL